MRHFLFVMIFAACHSFLFAQSIQMTRESVVKDSTGKIYSYESWMDLYYKGHEIRAVDINNPKSEFIITILSKADLEKKMEGMPKPGESNFFKTGEKINPFVAIDLEGNKIDIKELKGKIVLLNFWFINCPPCRKEMPELNEMVDSFKKNDHIAFVSIALDNKTQLEDFLKTTPFKYRIINDGGNVAAQYGVGLYPTNVVLDPDGKIVFHTSGFALNTVYWLKKSIKDLLKEPKPASN